MDQRRSNTLTFFFASGATESNAIDLDRGAFGTIIVASGSDAIGKTLQFVAMPEHGVSNPFPETDLLTSAKTLSAGANPISSDELTQVGASRRTKLKLNSSVSEDTFVWLLWKS